MGDFWKSFCRETGRNSGKWTSNKLFGKTGWATPRRHILDIDKSKSKRTKRTKKSKIHETDTENYDLLNSINSYNVNGSVNSIVESLDNLFTFLDTDAKDSAIQKIKSGIFHLKRKNAVKDSYYKRRLFKKRYLNIIIGIFIYLLIMIILYSMLD